MLRVHKLSIKGVSNTPPKGEGRTRGTVVDLYVGGIPGRFSGAHLTFTPQECPASKAGNSIMDYKGTLIRFLILEARSSYTS